MYFKRPTLFIYSGYYLFYLSHETYFIYLFFFYIRVLSQMYFKKKNIYIIDKEAMKQLH